ncbi:trans-Golgi network integral membrane protein 1 isoform X2 [Procambarus clarkii]|uniref:trans-Golgi network integral membrane protein 1 isoform X2 n=1 Tax=Procambarus clarkii TaxID=6728 RepID=UPI001E676D6F|nr:trans-Golgi network integral membrane protein 1-like isoform X2 [Procambarus clarkii]
MKGDHVVLVLVSCTLCISVPTSAAPPHKKNINTAIAIQQRNETLSENTERQKSKPGKVLIQDKNDEPVRRLKDDELKLDDNPDHKQPQQSRTDSKLNNPGQDKKQSGVDPNIDDNPGQDEKQSGADPKVDDNPGQDEKQSGADPKVDDNPGQDEKQSGADPKVDDNPGQDELQPEADPNIDGKPGQGEKQPGADPKGADKPGQDEQQPTVEQELGDTSGQAAQSRDDEKFHNSPGHNHEISIDNSDYKKDSDPGIISAGNDQENKKSEAKSQDTENLITEEAADNTEDTQDPGDSEVKEDPDTSNTALASVKEDSILNTNRDSSVQNSDVKDGERPGDVQRKEPDNRKSHPIIFPESSNPSVAPLPTQGIQDPNKSTPGSEKVSSSMKTTTTTTTTVSSLPIVAEIAKPEDYQSVEAKMGKASDSQSENDLSYDDNSYISDPHEEGDFEVKPAGNEEAPSQVNNGGKFRDDEDSHFFAYFLTIMVTAIIFYLVFHNKQRIIALIIEGRAPRSGRTRRSSSRAKYHKLDNNLEEAITATKGSKKLT